MRDFTWSQTEKRLAREVFERARVTELAELVADFKQKVSLIESPDDMWPLARYLDQIQRDFEDKYDYRYSVLIYVFARLVREGRVQDEELQGFSADKREYIQGLVSLKF